MTSFEMHRLWWEGEGVEFAEGHDQRTTATETLTFVNYITQKCDHFQLIHGLSCAHTIQSETEDSYLWLLIG